jgi:hypothetical protein
MEHVSDTIKVRQNLALAPAYSSINPSSANASGSFTPPTKRSHSLSRNNRLTIPSLHGVHPFAVGLGEAGKELAGALDLLS